MKEFLTVVTVMVLMPTTMLMAYLVFDELKHKLFGETVKDLSKKVELMSETIGYLRREKVDLENEISGLESKIVDSHQKIFNLSKDRHELLALMEDK